MGKAEIVPRAPAWKPDGSLDFFPAPIERADDHEPGIVGQVLERSGGSLERVPGGSSDE